MKIITLGVWAATAWSICGAELPVKVELDPVSANAFIRYQVPANMPDPVIVRASMRRDKDDKFAPAAINKFRSETILHRFTDFGDKTLLNEQTSGEVREFLAAGRERTLVWRTYPQLPVGETVRGEVKVQLSAPEAPDAVLAEGTASFEFDFSGIKVLHKFAGNPEIYPPIVLDKRTDQPSWYDSGSGLDCVEKDNPLEPLAWRHGLRGKYAIHVYVPITGYSMISLRLTSDDYSQRIGAVDGLEYFWKIAPLDNTHIVIQDSYPFLSRIGDHARARLGYIKLVPVAEKVYADYQESFHLKRDKIVAAFFEPYSWAFSEYVRDNGKFSEPMAAYKEACVDIVDSQVGRLGMKFLFPTDLGMPLLGATAGDAHVDKDGKVKSGTVSLGTGRMVRLNDALKSSLKYANAEGLQCGINFGAGPSYNPGNPLRSEFSDAHPAWGVQDTRVIPNATDFLSFRHPEVRAYYLEHFRAALNAGATLLTVNFKTYPHGVESAADSLAFLRELRKLADGYEKNGVKIKLMVLFVTPGNRGVTENNKFEPKRWVQEGLVDYLVPSALSDTNLYFFDPAPYVEMVKGSKTKLLVEFSVSACSPLFPLEILKLVDRIYDAGADGIYIYQADARIVGSMNAVQEEERRWIRVLGSSSAVKEAIRKLEAKQSDYSVGMATNFTYLFQAYRAQIWPDGMTPKKIEISLLDTEGAEKVRSVRTAWPWVLGELGVEHHYPTGGPFILKAVASDAVTGKTYEQQFNLPRINRSVSF